MFLKKGAKVPHKRTPPVGILQYASDWVLLADLNSNYCFPVHIAFTQLRPDITIFSNSLRMVFLIELTCPCEENMESWHSTKINNYLALKTVIESNGWCVELFAVELGHATGYCSKPVLCCFKKLGFNNTCIRNTIKKLSKSSMECSFCIWLARNNEHWNPAANGKLNDPSKETCNLPSSLSSPKQTNNSVSNTKSIRPVGFINKGNTYYANSVLQIRVVPNLWSRVPSESNTLLPMSQAISLNMAVKKNSTKPVDPSNFLWALKRKLSIIRGVPSDFNTQQQDVAEILQVVLDEVKGISLAASHLICNTQKITVSCNTCFCSTLSEENLDIMTLPESTDIQTSMNQFLKPEILSSQNKWFCPSCNLLSESTRETCIINSAPILIIQLCRFSNQGGQLVKNENFFSCTRSESNKDLTFPIPIEDEVSFANKY